jgi:hypothetical protein
MHIKVVSRSNKINYKGTVIIVVLYLVDFNVKFSQLK